MIFRLDPDILDFPSPLLAEDDGLLAVGGDLQKNRLLKAYQAGIFPWYSEETPILWYAPHERFVLNPKNIVISKSMKKLIERNEFKITFNTAFTEVIQNCANVFRKDQDGTWIVNDMQRAYFDLHQEGYAHSIEVWKEETLVGGLYGVSVGKVFCGESMFSLVSNASKAALIYLCQHFDLDIVDCQIHSNHLESMGASLVASAYFYSILEKQIIEPNGFQKLFRHTS